MRADFGKSRGEGGSYGKSLPLGGGGYGYFLEPHNLDHTYIIKTEVYFGVRTCDISLCFIAIFFSSKFLPVRVCSLSYITGENHMFLHQRPVC